MPAQPEGDVPPLDGSLPASALDSSRTLAAYVHVPYCRVRCGYCDFNTYTASELGKGANREDYPDQIASEIDLAARVLGEPRALNSVFFGGGTPTLLPASVLGGVLSQLKSVFGVVTGAEVTTEANPDTLSLEYLSELARSGFTRVSVGMQSAVDHVLHGVAARTTDADHLDDGAVLHFRFDHVKVHHCLQK